MKKRTECPKEKQIFINSYHGRPLVSRIAVHELSNKFSECKYIFANLWMLFIKCNLIEVANVNQPNLIG